MSESIYVKRKMQYVLNTSRIITIYYYEFDKNYAFGGESHDFWEMVYVDKGEVTVICEKGEIPIKRGEVIFHYPNEFHDIMANKVVAPNVFIISFECKSSAMKYFKGKHIKLTKEQINIIRSLLCESANTFDMNSKCPGLSLAENPIFGGQQMIKLYLEQLLIDIIRNEGAKVFSSRKNTKAI